MLQGMSQVATGLVAAGTPVNMRDVSADTPLHLASLYGFFFGFFFCGWQMRDVGVFWRAFLWRAAVDVVWVGVASCLHSLVCM